MPGVPSGKGCNACRKQKKKCDWSGSICSRCRRLQVSCVGGGQQRYKFMISDQDNPVQKVAARPDVVSSSITRYDDKYNAWRPVSFSVHACLSNEHTRRVGAFVEKLNPSLSVKYHLAWTFGDYLLEVPARLGTNSALDAAADALVAGYTRFSTRGQPQTDLVLTKYNEALRILRACLDDPIQAKSSETLCAVMLLMICQMFVGGNAGGVTSHIEGAAQILKFRNRPDPNDHFECKLLQTLRGPLLFEALFSDRIHFTDKEWYDLAESHLDEGGVVGDMMRALARTPRLIHRAKRALEGPADMMELKQIEIEAGCLRQITQPALDEFKRLLLDKTKPKIPSGYDVRILEELVYSTRIRLRALALAITLIINHISASVADNPYLYLNESDDFAEEIVQLAQEGKAHRPLGASALAVSSLIAWVGTSRPDLRSSIEALHHDFEADFWEPGDSMSYMSSLYNSPLASIGPPWSQITTCYTCSLPDPDWIHV